MGRMTVSDEYLKVACKYAGHGWDGKEETRGEALAACTARLVHAERHLKDLRAKVNRQRSAMKEFGRGAATDHMTWRMERQAMRRTVYQQAQEIERLTALVDPDNPTERRVIMSEDRLRSLEMTFVAKGKEAGDAVVKEFNGDEKARPITPGTAISVAVRLYSQLLDTCAKQKGIIEGLAARVAAQAETLALNAEKVTGPAAL